MSNSLTRGTPVFELEVIASDIAFEVRVNDLPVLRMPAGRVQTAFDVNPQIEDGPNKLSLIVKPRTRGRDFSENAACKVEIRQRPSPESDAVESIGTLVFSGYGTNAITGFSESTSARGGGPVEVERFGAKATLGFEVSAPFGQWEWATAERLRPTEQLRAELVAEMRKIHGLLARRDGEALSKLCALQARDYQRAYYLASLEEAHRMLGIDQILADPTVEIDAFPDSILTVEILGGGRLAQLVDDEGKSPLTLRSADAPSMVGRFAAVLCRTAEGFQIAR